MRVNLIFVLTVCLFAQVSFSQNGKKSASHKAADVAAIEQMCGCFEVSFEFAETFSPDTAYRFHKRYETHGLEWVELVEKSGQKLVLQHLLIVDDSTVIKHWRQDWLYENTELLVYDKDNRWVPRHLSGSAVRGQWTQKVYQVDDSPRYEGTATWVHVDGKHYWENTTDSPLPRREYTKRSDYNVMNRGNRHEITPEGWLHEQDNRKIIRSSAGDRLLAQEKGWNAYVRVPAKRCKPAQDWWVANSEAWVPVRQAWANITAAQKAFSLSAKVDGKFLYQRLPAEKPLETERIIREYVRFEYNKEQ